MELFEKHLKEENLSQKTIDSYLKTIKNYKAKFKSFTKNNLLSFKGYLIENYKAKTVNLRLQAINKFLSFKNKNELKLKFVKLQETNYLENIISDADYSYLKTQLLTDKNYKGYFLVRFLCATGARVSELIMLKIEHIQKGFFDIYSKGGKIRRLYIPKALCEEAMIWQNSLERHSGYLFLNKNGGRLTTRGVASNLKHYAIKYGINPNVVYPHSFRHRFAKNFLEKYNDLALLADLMGHESIETTRIYLRRTTSEQYEIVNNVVTW